MPLDEDRIAEDLVAALAAFDAKKPTVLLDHGRNCCKVARDWFGALDRSMRGSEDGTGAPAWLRMRFEWGPSTWPTYWCEAIERRVSDCGTLAALARESFCRRGVAAFPAQVVRLFSDSDRKQWERAWQKACCCTDWIHGAYVYHEAVAVIRSGIVRVWDPTEVAWVEPELQACYAGVVAIRIIATSSQSTRELAWGRHRLTINTWAQLEAERA